MAGTQRIPGGGRRDRRRGRGLARLVGLASTAIGIRLLADPADADRRMGIRPTEQAEGLTMAVGVQELLVGAGLLIRPRSRGLLRLRVAGDVLHLLLLRGAMTVRRNDGDRIRSTMWAVGGTTVLDLLALRRLRGTTTGTTHRAMTSVTINRDPDEVYRSWRDFEQLPRFMAHLESVKPSGDGRYHWVARAPGGKAVEWDAEILEDQPGHVLSWRSVGGDVDNAGAVHFRSAPGDRGTEVTVELEYTPPGGKAGVLAATVFGEAPSQQIRDDLRRFKQVVETGQVVLSDAAPEGLTSARQVEQQPARPHG